MTRQGFPVGVCEGGENVYNFIDAARGGSRETVQGSAGRPMLRLSAHGALPLHEFTYLRAVSQGAANSNFKKMIKKPFEGGWIFCQKYLSWSCRCTLREYEGIDAQ